jgi:hypothetical protein
MVMAYDLSAFVGPHAMLEEWAKALGDVRVCSLTQGFALVPMLDDQDSSRARRVWGDPPDAITPFTTFESSWAEESSRLSALAFIQIECWGGDCERGAIVWENGAVVLGPFDVVEDVTTEEREARRLLWETDPAAAQASVPEQLAQLTTNQALRRIGVTITEGLYDEFESLGLGAARNTADWCPSERWYKRVIERRFG